MFILEFYMEVKRLLRFYFFADGLDRTLDGLIMKCACDFCGDGEAAAEKICGLIEKKRALAGLWDYLDKIASGLSEGERGALKYYARLRRGLRSLPDEIKKAVDSAVAKFKRRANRLNCFSAERKLLGEYYCLLRGD